MIALTIITIIISFIDVVIEWVLLLLLWLLYYYYY